VFNEVKRDTELLNLSKLLKSNKGGSGVPHKNNSSSSVNSNYMQVTQSWAGKNKVGPQTSNPIPLAPT
jgi:hypothetical protein